VIVGWLWLNLAALSLFCCSISVKTCYAQVVVTHWPISTDINRKPGLEQKGKCCDQFIDVFFRLGLVENSVWYRYARLMLGHRIG